MDMPTTTLATEFGDLQITILRKHDLLVCSGSQTPLTVNRVQVDVRIRYNKQANGWDVDRYQEGGCYREIIIRKHHTDNYFKDKAVSSKTYDKTRDAVSAAVKFWVATHEADLLKAEYAYATNQRELAEKDVEKAEEVLAEAQKVLAEKIEAQNAARDDIGTVDYMSNQG